MHRLPTLDSNLCSRLATALALLVCSWRSSPCRTAPADLPYLLLILLLARHTAAFTRRCCCSFSGRCRGSLLALPPPLLLPARSLSHACRRGCAPDAPVLHLGAPADAPLALLGGGRGDAGGERGAHLLLGRGQAGVLAGGRHRGRPSIHGNGHPSFSHLPDRRSRGAPRARAPHGSRGACLTESNASCSRHLAAALAV